MLCLVCVAPLFACDLLKVFLFAIMTGSKAAVKLEDILMSKYVLKDIRQLSSTFQTSSIEAFHSLLNHFSPKMFGFSYMGVDSR